MLGITKYNGNTVKFETAKTIVESKVKSNKNVYIVTDDSEFSKSLDTYILENYGIGGQVIEIFNHEWLIEFLDLYEVHYDKVVVLMDNTKLPLNKGSLPIEYREQLGKCAEIIYLVEVDKENEEVLVDGDLTEVCNTLQTNFK